MPAPDPEQAVWFFGFLFVATLVLGAALIFAFRRLAGSSFQPAPELGCAGLVLGAALAGMGPNMARTTAVGAGDAYHYALQAADFVTQLRAGVFPVLVGQSIYGFNGNIHTLRTAPYYTHFCGLLDLLTWHHLSAFALQNLVALLAALGGATTAYCACRVLLPEYRLGPALLAAVYITTPGVAGALLGGDMYAAFMAVPWLPVVILAAVQMLEREDARGPLALLTGAYALVWWAHAPTAILLAPLVGLAGVLRLARGPRRGQFLGDAILATAGFGALATFVFYSVSSMQLAYIAKDLESTAPLLISGLPSLWPGLLLPVSADGHAVTDLQPGYPVLFLVAASPWLIRKAGWGQGLLLVAILGYCFACVPTSAAAWIWQALPARVINIIQPWPDQRMMPIIAALAVVSGSLGAPRLVRRYHWFRLVFLGMLTTGLIWNLTELRKFNAVARHFPRIATVGQRPLPADSTVLTRSSYLLFRDYPDYYSHGYMEPAAETRLLGSKQELMLTNISDLLARGAPASDWRDLSETVRFPLQPGWGCALEFKFAQPDAVGEVVLASGSMHRDFSLPVSGERLAFGAGIQNNHTLLVRADAHDGRLIDIHTSVPGAAVRSLLYREESLPIRVTELIPFTVLVRSPRAGFLESPRVFLPGYHATVDNKEAAVLRSPEGLVMVPTPPGNSVVKIDYPGPPGLRAAFFLALLGFLSWPLATVALYRARSINSTSRTAKGIRGLALVAIVGAMGAALWHINSAQTSRGNTWRLEIDLPRVPKVAAEPLLVLGRRGLADIIYIRYDDSHHFSLCYDHWGAGGPSSAPITCVPGQQIVIEATLPTLSAGSVQDQFAGKPAPMRISVDGREVLVAKLPWYSVPPGMVAVGVNAIEASSCVEHFSGRVVASRRVIRPDP